MQPAAGSPPPGGDDVMRLRARDSPERVCLPRAPEIINNAGNRAGGRGYTVYAEMITNMPVVRLLFLDAPPGVGSDECVSFLVPG